MRRWTSAPKARRAVSSVVMRFLSRDTGGPSCLPRRATRSRPSSSSRQRQAVADQVVDAQAAGGQQLERLDAVAEAAAVGADEGVLVVVDGAEADVQRRVVGRQQAGEDDEAAARRQRRDRRLVRPGVADGDDGDVDEVPAPRRCTLTCGGVPGAAVMNSRRAACGSTTTTSAPRRAPARLRSVPAGPAPHTPRTSPSPTSPSSRALRQQLRGSAKTASSSPSPCGTPDQALQRRGDVLGEPAVAVEAHDAHLPAEVLGAAPAARALAAPDAGVHVDAVARRERSEPDRLRPPAAPPADPRVPGGRSRRRPPRRGRAAASGRGARDGRS